MSPKKRSRDRRNASRRTWLFALGASGLIVVGGYGLFLAAGSPRPASSRELPTAGPIEAVHEMAPYRAPVRISDPPPDIALSHDSFDFGTIPDRGVQEHRLEVQNLGRGDLVVSAFYTSCGCTTARLSAGIVPRGGSAELTVRFDPAFHEVEGEVWRAVIIETNDPDEPRVEFLVRAEVVPG